MSYHLSIRDGIRVHELLTQTQFLEKINEILVQDGVEADFAKKTASVFLVDLKAGKKLVFSDLGSIQLKEKQIEIIPIEQNLEATFKTSGVHYPSQYISNLPSSVHTVEEETSIRYLEQHGYSRQRAESVLYEAKR